MKFRSHKKKAKKLQRILSVLLIFCVVFAEGSQHVTFAEAAGDAGFHQHGDSCYEERLVCGMEEHADGCYSKKLALACGMEEDESHAHGEDCYRTEKELVCVLEEHQHVHTDDCYGEELVCGLDAARTTQAAGEEGDGQNLEGDMGAGENSDACGEEEKVVEDGSDLEENGIGDADAAPEAPDTPVGSPEDGSGTEEDGNVTEDGSGPEEDSDVTEDGSGTEEDGNVTEDGSSPEEDGSVTEDGDVTEGGSGTEEDGDVTEGGSGTEEDSDVTEDGSGPEEDGNVTEGGSGTEEDGDVTEGGSGTEEDGDVTEDGNGPEEEGGTDGDSDQEESEMDPAEEEIPDAVPDETMWVLDCDIAEESHVHTDGCYARIYCGTKEHAHTEGCYDVAQSLVCGKEEHLHTDECFLVDEIRAEIQRVSQMVGTLPAYEEIEASAAALEGDEEAYAAYMIQLMARVQEAYAAYMTLSEELRQYVEGAEYLLLLSGILDGVTLETNEATVMEPDEAYVNDIAINSMTTGTAPFDEAEGRGNDTAAEDKIVRSFDSVTYNFNVNMKSWDIKKNFKEARVKLEFVLPRTEGEAVFDQSAMTWMDTAEGYAPVLTTEFRTIDGKETECQVLTCYKRLLPAEGSLSVVPGDFGENLTIYVKSMHNGETFAPIISAAMEGGTWEGVCENEDHVDAAGTPVLEKKSVIPDLVTVTAAPRYNIQLDSESSYRGIFDFQGDAEWMEKYGGIAANTDITQPIPGRLMKLGITLQLYNAENPAKGLKGIELPQGPISFDLDVSSVYTPTSTSEHGGTVDTTADYTPLLWSYGENREIKYGEGNTDGRVIYDRTGCLELAPYFEHNENREGSDCWNSGTWNATQEGSTIHIMVSDYAINLEHMPTKNLPGGQELYTSNIGCFSSGGIWLVQPFNKRNSDTDAGGPKYDIIDEYGAGAFATTAETKNLQGTTETGETFKEGEDGFSQSVTTDDREVRILELNLLGAMQNRVRYAGDHDHWWLGSGVDDIYDGNDYATVGDELYLVGGFSYDSGKEEENQLYLGTNLIRFYGSAIELTGEGASNLVEGASLGGHSGKSMDTWWLPDPTKENIRIYYAAKPDGTDWTDDWEMQHTHEDGLVFFDSLESIPEGKVCVGILTCFIGPGPAPESDKDSGSYYYYHQARVREDKDLAGKSFALVSTSRVWTKEMFEVAGKGLSDIGLGTDHEVNVRDWIMEANMLEDTHYKSANIEGSTWYVREQYKEDGSGVEGTHNSEWEHWGDTLLIIGYRTSITKHLLQKDMSGEEKKNFNLDASQRVADFMLQPRTYYEKQGEYDHTAPITIVDVLPRYMTYKPGTAYFGGKYEQASPDGGTKGSIVEDTAEDALFPRPVLTEPQVTKNPDGTETLTWVIENVKIGEPMAPIYYSVDIGNADPVQDVPIGTTDLKNTSYITAPEDMRDPQKTAEKHSEAGIAVNRGSASSFGKYTKQKLVEEDGEIDYVIYFNNNADTEADLAIMDTMPASGINGSEFTGTYTFAEWKLDTAKCDVDKLKIYYTFEEEYKDKTTYDVKKEEIEGTKEGSYGKWIQTTIRADGTIEIPTPPEGKEKHPIAWAVVGKLDAKKSVYIDLKIKLDPGPSEPDRDKSNYFVNLLSSGDTTTITENPTVRRTLEGLAWMDYDRDGIQGTGDTEPRINGVKVELLKLREGMDGEGNAWDPGNEASYENVCYPGSKMPIAIQTGKQISVRAAAESVPADYKPNGEDGHYKFLDLPAGTFAVRFTDEDGNEIISNLNPTQSNAETDDTKDSDGIPAYGNDGKLQKTVILNLPMPKAEKMSVTLYKSEYHDSGFYPDTLMKVQKVDDAGGILAGAVFTVQNARGETLAFTYKEGEGYYLKGYEKRPASGMPGDASESQETTELRADNSGKLSIHNLLPGDYDITEVEAPQGYILLSRPMEFTLKMDETNSYIELRGDSVNNSMVSLKTEDGGTVPEGGHAILMNIKNFPVYELPSTGGPGTGTCAAAGLLMMTASATYALLNRRKRSLK